MGTYSPRNILYNDENNLQRVDMYLQDIELRTSLKTLYKITFLITLSLFGFPSISAETENLQAQEEPQQNITMARLLEGKCKPILYPRMSKANGEEGKVVVTVTVGIDGKATNAQLIKSSGYSELDLAAIQYATECQYTPRLIDGKPVESKVQMPVVFKLEDDVGADDKYQVSDTMKLIFEKNLTKTMQVKYVGKSEIIRTICRIGKMPLVTARKMQPFQFYLADAFNEELRNSNKFSADGLTLKLEVDSMEVSTLGQGSWKVDISLYIEESSKIKVSVSYPFDKSIPKRAPCKNAIVIFPSLVSEIIKTAFTEPKILALLN